MKKQILLVALVALGFNSNAQLQINLSLQPLWGPVGYDHVDYYYMPDIDAYYDVPHRQYTYMENNTWVTRENLPPRYGNYDPYRGHKVVVNESRPWLHNDRYRQQYGQYKGRNDQHAIRDSRDNRYYANPNHPHHSEWNNGNHPGPGADHGHGNQGGGHGNPQGGPGNPQGGHDNGHGNQGGGHGNPQGGHGNPQPQGGHDNGHGNPQGGHGNPQPQGGHDNGHGNPQGGHGNPQPQGGHDNGHGNPQGGHGHEEGGHERR